MTVAQVAIVKGARSIEPVNRVLDLIDFKEALKGWDRVLIKVNFITTKTWDTGATTDPVVVEALIHRLKGLSLEVVVVESDATITNATRAFHATGMADLCERNDVEWVNLRFIKDRVELQVPNGAVLKKIVVPRIVAESGIVSAAKLKTHSETLVTLGMKNLFGLLPDKMKGKYHLKGMHKVITDITEAITPHLTIVDGFVAMEGRGPVGGTPVNLDTIIAGRDVVAVDATSARIMGIDPKEVGHIVMAHERGLGEMNNIDVLGNQISSVKKIFRRP